MAGMLIVNPRDGSWWVGGVEDPRVGAWPCTSREQAIALAHSILAAGGGGEVLVEDGNGEIARKDSVLPARGPSRGRRQTVVQMPDGSRRSILINPETAARTRLLMINGRRYRVAGVDATSEPVILILHNR